MLKAEMEGFKEAAKYVTEVYLFLHLHCSIAKEKYVKMKKERDYHRMHHRQTLQEKNRLITDIKRYIGCKCVCVCVYRCIYCT